MRLQLFWTLLSISILLSAAAQAEERFYLVFPSDASYTNSDTINVSKKKVKLAKYAPFFDTPEKVKLKKSDNSSIQFHLDQVNAWQNNIHFIARTIEDESNNKPDPVMEIASSARRSSAIITQAIIPILKSESLGNAKELLADYVEHRNQAHEAMSENKLIDHFNQDRAKSLLLGLDAQLKSFERAAAAVEVCTPLVGAKRVRVSTSEGIVPLGVLVPAEEHVPGSSESDFTNVILRQRLQFADSQESARRFQFSGAEMDEIYVSLKAYEKFGKSVQAQAASWALGLGAFDARIIEMAAQLVDDPTERNRFNNLIKFEARRARISDLQRALEYEFDPITNATLKTSYAIRFPSLTSTNTLIEATHAAEAENPKALADLINFYVSQEGSEADLRQKLFRLGLELLHTHPNTELFAALIDASRSQDERLSLFESVQRFHPTERAEVLQIVANRVHEDFVIARSEQTSIIENEFDFDNLSPAESSLIELDTEDPSATAVLIALIRRQAQGDIHFAMPPERAALLDRLRLESEGHQKILGIQIEWLKEAILENEIPAEQRASMLLNVAILELEATDNWKASISTLGAHIGESANESDVLHAFAALDEALPYIVQAASRDEMKKSEMKAQYNKFVTEFYRPHFAEMWEVENPTQDQKDLVALQLELQRSLGESKLNEILRAIAAEVRSSASSWSGAAEKHLEELLKSFTEKYLGGAS